MDWDWGPLRYVRNHYYLSAKLLRVARRFDVRENHVTRSSRSLAGLEAVILIAQATAPALINWAEHWQYTYLHNYTCLAAVWYCIITHLATDNRQRITGNRQRTTDNRQRTTDTRQRPTDNRQRTWKHSCSILAASLQHPWSLQDIYTLDKLHFVLHNVNFFYHFCFFFQPQT